MRTQIGELPNWRRRSIFHEISLDGSGADDILIVELWKRANGSGQCSRRWAPLPTRRDWRCSAFWLAATQGLAASAIAETLGIAPSSLSFHLQELVHAGLITQRRLSRSLIYSAEYAAMNQLVAYLTENCCGRGAACAPVCNPEDLLAKGDSHEAVSCARAR
jgi:DNA-binding transcriptional ArsR family regulator